MAVCGARIVDESEVSTTPSGSILPLLDFVQPRLQRLHVVRIGDR